MGALMRKFFTLCISAVLAFSLSGCVSGDTSAEPTSTSVQAEDTSTVDTTLGDEESPSESELDVMFAQDLAESLLFSFDNFQCWSGDDCKVIYNLEYFGSAGTHKILEFGWNTTGQIIGPNGEVAEVGTIVVKGADGVAFGYFESGITYRVIINTSSELAASYQSIYLENSGVALLEEDFGCFTSEPETVQTSPTC